jgi:hypothetical protein
MSLAIEVCDLYCLPEMIVMNLLCSGSNVIPSLTSQPHVRFLYLPEHPVSLSILPFFLTAPIKVTLQSIAILIALLMRIPHPPEFILAQVHLYDSSGIQDR